MFCDCEPLMPEVRTGVGAEPRQFTAETDRVHLLLHYPPTLALSGLGNRLKGMSSRRLRQQYSDHARKYLCGIPSDHPLYFAASCVGASLTMIKQYIEPQTRPE
jgi:putative transposase